jgi:lysophospholipase L1-like esterase
MSNFYDGRGNVINISNGEGATADDFLSGKTWLCIGDSISEYPGYRQMIVDKYQLNALTGGFIGGLRVGYSGGASNCVLERLDKISEGTPDIITIALGTNDQGEIGTINDNPDTQTEESYTFIGCYKALIERLFDKYGYVPMMLMTPYPRRGGGKGDISTAIKEIGAYYSIPVFDMYHESGLPIGTLTDTGADDFMFAGDGLHVNQLGGAISAPKVANKMSLIIQKWDFPHTNLLSSGAASRTLTTTAPVTVFAYVKPDYSTDFDKIVWRSSDENVAKVTPSLKFTQASVVAVANGNCKITATLGEFTVTYDITVALS